MSKRWLKEHFSDQYVKRARSEGYRARSAYKLIEIQNSENFIKRGMNVLDLGASPGAWSQVISELVGESGSVLALDLLDIRPIKNVVSVKADILEEKAIQVVEFYAFKERKFDAIISDLAPNLTGIKSRDHFLSLNLAEAAFNFAQRLLASGGYFLVKLFDGPSFTDYRKSLAEHFAKVKLKNPNSSRSRSREHYLFARGFIG